jgi:hypothetical protein
MTFGQILFLEKLFNSYLNCLRKKLFPPPGTGNVVTKVVNTATVEFPLTISVQPYVIEAEGETLGSARGWDNGGSSSSSSGFGAF